MTDIRIEVDGIAGGAASLYNALTSRRLPSGVELEPVSRSDGALGVVDTILAGVSAATGIAALVQSTVAWRQTKGGQGVAPSVSFVVGEVSIRIDNADEKTVAMVWDSLRRNRSQDGESAAEELP